MGVATWLGVACAGGLLGFGVSWVGFIVYLRWDS